jgi:4-aminobutyrate aminotransferase-like enzyme
MYQLGFKDGFHGMTKGYSITLSRTHPDYTLGYNDGRRAGNHNS